MKDVLKNYVAKKHGVGDSEKIIEDNHLDYIYTDKPHNVKFLFNKANVILLQNELSWICKIFDKERIEYITFKGIVLSTRLYDNIYTRFFCDIDIYVFPQCFDRALNMLFDNGYTPKDQTELSNPHHVTLKKDRITVELHRNILNPFTKINETYMYNHTEIFDLAKQKIVTLDLTGTFLHLIYHLYMDAKLLLDNIYDVYTRGRTPSIKRFYARAYEIALFSQKYSSKINWDEVISDINKQDLHIIFKSAFNDILDIFPNAFPRKLVDVIHNREYTVDEKYAFYKCIINSNSPTVQTLS